MTEQRRSAYQQEMDAIHVPKEKADETLKMMLEENRRLRQKEAAKEAKSPFLRRLPVLAGALAAAAVLLVVGLTAGNSGAYTFEKIGLSASPVSNPLPGGETRDADPEEILGASPASFFPGWEVTDATASETVHESGALREARFVLSRNGQEMTAAVTDEEPEVFRVLQREQKIAGKPVRLGITEATDTRVAAWTQDGRYFVLRSSLPEKEFIEAVKNILEH